MTAQNKPFIIEHDDDFAVYDFALRMQAKMKASREKGRSGWDNPEICTTEYLSKLLIEHIPKGDVVDIANFCMMLHQRAAAPMVLVEAFYAGHPTTEVARLKAQLELAIADRRKDSALIHQLRNRIGGLMAAVRELAQFVEGRLPLKGWLKDNDKSREALDKLLNCLEASPIDPSGADLFGFDPKDLKIEAFRDPKAGNWTHALDTNIRVTHMPTGLFIDCSSERSQWANRTKALQSLRQLVAEQGGAQ